jgi:protein phosphatase 1 regulatory subunit 12A
MLSDEANMQKQKKREEQLRQWKQRENDILNSNTQTINNFQKQNYQRQSKVRFPKGCVFLAACSAGDIDEVKQHLKMGVNINTSNIDGLTALHQACIDANIEMVKFLVENDADINAQDNEGWTPLHAGISVGNLEVSK